MSTVIKGIVAVYVALVAAVVLVSLIASAFERARYWWRNRPSRKFPWFPPEGHPDAYYEMTASERDVFVALMARAEVE